MGIRRRFAPRSFALALATLVLSPAAAGATIVNPPSTVTLVVAGAGTVVTTAPSGDGSCTAPTSTVTGVVGATCSFVTEGTPFLTFGRAITLQAQPPPGWTFLRWSGNADGTGAPCFNAQPSADCTTTVGSCLELPCTYFDRTVRADFVDSRPPDTVIDSGPVGTVVDERGRATFAFHTPDEPDERPTFECRLDPGPAATADAGFASCSSPLAFEALSDGPHHFEVRAVDGSGLKDPSPAARDWTEETPPQTVITSGPNPAATSTSNEAVLTFEASKTGARFECQLDGGAFAACTSPATFGALADGQHVIAVRAIDARGNIDQTPVLLTWTIDTTPPETTIESGPDEGLLTNSSRARFDLRSEAGARFECRLDTAGFAPCGDGAGTVLLDVVGTGSHRFEARAIDSAGNADASPASRTWTITADLDRDGFILPRDCDDENPGIHPGARDIPQDGIDQDCSGRDAPFPRLSLRLRSVFAVTGSSTALVLLTVDRPPAGLRVEVFCQGRSCPFARHNVTVNRQRKRLPLVAAFHRAQLRAGTRLDVRLTKKATIGQLIRFTMRDGVFPRRVELCLPPGTRRPIAC